jgi:hypothetical protein
VFCVCVPTTKHESIVIEQGLREIFILKQRVSKGVNRTVQ